MTSESIADIPVFEVGLLPSADLCRQNLDRVRNLIDEALSGRSHLLLPIAARLLDRGAQPSAAADRRPSSRPGFAFMAGAAGEPLS